MSEYKAPQPEMHVPIDDLDIRPEKPTWLVFKKCEKCDDGVISMPQAVHPDAWPDYCRDCTDYTECSCDYNDITYAGPDPYPVRQSYKSGVMPNLYYGFYGDGPFVCEC